MTTATAPPAPLSFRDVLRIDVMRRVRQAAAALAATFTIGLAFAAIMVPAQTPLQRETSHDTIGRVSSTNISVAGVAVVMAAGRRALLHARR